MTALYDKLKKYDSVRMHMPGHKRSAASFPHLANLSARQDITEITGFDNLHDAHGILKESMNTAAHLRGAGRAFYLINGSTCGILAAISACVPFGGKIIMARNCHKSVYNAAELIHAQTVYITPEHEPFTGGYGCISPDAVRTAIAQNHDAHAMVITSPTNEGSVSDIRKICDIAHSAHIPVIVDAAHGAHFGYADFPKDAVSYGGDIVIESLHKTLSGLTQTAVCYVSGNIADADKIEKKLSVFESSSPSYLLLSSIDGCIKMLYSDGDELFSPWITALNDFYRRAKNLKNFNEIYAFEYSEKAFSYLNENIKNFESKVKAVKGNIFEDYNLFKDNYFDYIVSNPPYIKTQDIKTLDREVLHEPKTALDGGQTGLDFYVGICKFWTPKIKPGGILAFEIGQGMHDDVAEIMKNSGFEKINFSKDINGIIRCVMGFKK